MSQYVDDELSTRGRRRLAAHTSICPECHRVLATLQRMVSSLGELGRPKAPPAEKVADDVLARIEDQRGR